MTQDPGPRRTSRCPSRDASARAALVAAATWRCPTCGLIEPLQHEAGGTVYVRRRTCACLIDQRERERQEGENAAIQILRDQQRRQRALGGLEPGLRAWQMRFVTFQPDRQPDALALCQGWVRLLLDAAHTARRQASAQARAEGGKIDELAYQMVFPQLWHSALVSIPSLLLVGGPGLGKTHLALACYHALIDDDLRPIYAPGLVFLDQIRDRWDREEHEDTEERLLQRLIGADVLILDGPDVSARPWSATRWFRILDGRAELGRPSLVTGSSEQQLSASLGEEAYDRLCDGGCLMSLRGTSYRRRRMIAPSALRRRIEALPPAEEHDGSDDAP